MSPGSIRHGFLNALEVRLLQVQMWKYPQWWVQCIETFARTCSQSKMLAGNIGPACVTIGLFLCGVFRLSFLKNSLRDVTDGRVSQSALHGTALHCLPGGILSWVSLPHLGACSRPSPFWR